MRALLTSCFLNKLWYHDDDIVLKVISEKNPDYFQYIMPTWLQLSKLEINFKTRLFSIVKFKFLSRMNYRLNDSLNLVYFTGEVSFQLRFYCRISFKWERCTNWNSEILNYQCVFSPLGINLRKSQVICLNDICHLSHLLLEGKEGKRLKKNNAE